LKKNNLVARTFGAPARTLTWNASSEDWNDFHFTTEAKLVCAWGFEPQTFAVKERRANRYTMRTQINTNMGWHTGDDPVPQGPQPCVQSRYTNATT
jgi:hypothetical protein